MQPRSPRLVIHGVVGGIIAGAVVMVWFFFLDVIAGQPLATPTLLANTLLDRQIVEPSVGVVATYTVLHYGVFVVLGVLAVLGLQVLGIAPALRHGAVFGLGVLNAVHYGAFLATDAQVMSQLPAVHVVVANLLGGMAMMTYLHYVEHAEAPIGLGVLKHQRLLSEGLIAGLVGAVAVAVWFLLLDILAGQPFFTPAALGSAVFLGASSPAEVQVTLGVITAYTMLHLAAFFVVGLVFVWVSERIERTPGLWLLAFMGFIVVEGGFLGVAGLIGGWVLGAIGFIAVVGGNVLAVGAIGRWIWINHPGLREKLVEQPVATMV